MDELPLSLHERLIRIGRAQQMLHDILIDDPHYLSKHNPYWESESDVENEKLDEVRRKLSSINDKLYEAYGMIAY